MKYDAIAFLVEPYSANPSANTPIPEIQYKDSLEQADLMHDRAKAVGVGLPHYVLFKSEGDRVVVWYRGPKDTLLRPPLKTKKSSSTFVEDITSAFMGTPFEGRETEVLAKTSYVRAPSSSLVERISEKDISMT